MSVRKRKDGRWITDVKVRRGDEGGGTGTVGARLGHGRRGRAVLVAAVRGAGSVSTRCSIAYGDDWHLFRDLLEGSTDLVLEDELGDEVFTLEIPDDLFTVFSTHFPVGEDHQGEAAKRTVLSILEEYVKQRAETAAWCPVVDAIDRLRAPARLRRIINCACARPGGSEPQVMQRRRACTWATLPTSRSTSGCRCACHAAGALYTDSVGRPRRTPPSEPRRR